MIKLLLLVPPSKFDLVTLEKVADNHCPNDSAYIVPEGIDFKTIDCLKSEIEYYKNQSERRLKGLMYWKGRSD